VKTILKKIGIAILKFLKKETLWIIAIAGAVVTLKIIVAKIGKVDKPTNFVNKPGTDNIIQVLDEEKKVWIDLKLSKNKKAKDVVAAGLDKKKKWVVEIKHEKIYTDIFDD